MQHMITLSTRPDGTRGYRLFLDGMLAATLPSAFSGVPLVFQNHRVGCMVAGEAGYNIMTLAQVPCVADNPTEEADGGDAILLDGPLSLCNRADGDPSRSFHGYVRF